jgi:hypothetical protein
MDAGRRGRVKEGRNEERRDVVMGGSIHDEDHVGSLKRRRKPKTGKGRKATRDIGLADVGTD